MDEKEMRRYFITGGTGFVGRALIRKILKRPDTESVLCLTRGRDNLLQHEKLSYWKGDLTSVELPPESYRFTDIIHAAAEANDLTFPDQYRYYHDTLEGSRRIFEWAVDRVRDRFLLVSSGCVRKGDTAYCRAKRMAEWLLDHYSLQAKIARVYSLVGEEMPLNGQYAIGQFVGQALAGKVKLYGGNSVRSYLHVSDCADWLLRILDAGQVNRPYDVGSDRPIRVEDLAYLVAEVFGVKVEIVAPQDNRPSNSYIPYLAQIKHELGVRETVSLEKALWRIRDNLSDTYLEQIEAAENLH